MRILRGKPKGQSTIEYALILALVVVVVSLIMLFIISWVGQFLNAVANSLGLQTTTTVPSTSPIQRAFIIVITVVTTMGLPAVVSTITSFYDGAISNYPGQLAAGKTQVQRDNQGRCIKCKAIESYGRYSAKLCLSAISFEIWGLTNAFQDKVALHPDLGVQNSHLAILLVFLILIDIIFHYACSRWITDKHMWVRVFLVFSSMFIPVCIFYGLTV